MSIPSTLCQFCARFNNDWAAPKCAAFPKRIPPEVLFAEVDHREPYPGDGGVTFLLDPAKEEEFMQDNPGASPAAPAGQRIVQ
jgi:hypothetical protein